MTRPGKIDPGESNPGLSLWKRTPYHQANEAVGSVARQANKQKKKKKKKKKVSGNGCFQTYVYAMGCS